MTPKRKCDECGAPLTREPDGELHCVRCTPVVDEFHKEEYEHSIDFD